MRLVFTFITTCFLSIVFTQSIAQGFLIEPLKGNRTLEQENSKNIYAVCFQSCAGCDGTFGQFY